VRRAIFVTVALVLFAGACKGRKPASRSANAENQVGPRVVRLYYESPDLLLVPESRNVQLPLSSAGAMSLVARELVKGSANAGVPRLLPADTVVRGAFLLPEGTAFVDLGGATLTNGWPAGSHQELMAVYSIVQTITSNFAEAKRVRILVNGAPAETLAGHIALDRSLTPNQTLVDSRVR
jgi:germination protein M